jgi:hypothetical protein
MNEYIKHLKKEDAMISVSLQNTLSSRSVALKESIILIKSAEQELELHGADLFSLDDFECEIVFEAGITTIKKIQGMLNKKCNVSFYNFEQELQLTAYRINQVGSSQMTVALRFTVG